jgi:hypothetical protein
MNANAKRWTILVRYRDSDMLPYVYGLFARPEAKALAEEWERELNAPTDGEPVKPVTCQITLVRAGTEWQRKEDWHR